MITGIGDASSSTHPIKYHVQVVAAGAVCKPRRFFEMLFERRMTCRWTGSASRKASYW